MDAREARRRVARHCADSVSAGDALLAGWGAADRKRLTAAVETLRSELYRRAQSPSVPAIPSEPVIEPWSVSRSATWNTCRRQYAHRYVLRTPPAQPKSANQVFGTLVHHGLEHALAPLINVPLTADICDEAAYRGCRAMTEFAKGGEIRDVVLLDACRQVTATLHTFPLTAVIRGVENPITMMIDDVPIVGFIDLIFQFQGRFHVWDWKTGKIPVDPEELSRMPQMAVYAAAASTLYHVWLTSQVGLSPQVTVGLYSTRYQRKVDGEIDSETQEFFVRRLAAEAKSAATLRKSVGRFSVGEMYPTSSGEHCGSCPFRSYCPEFDGAVLPVLPGVDVAAEVERVGEVLHDGV